MSGSTTSLRTATLAELFRQLREHRALMPPVELCEGWPGPRMPERCVWVHDVDGEELWEVTMTSRHSRDDDFTILLRFRCARPNRSRIQVMAEVETYMDAVSYVIGTDCHLKGKVDGLGEIITGPKKGPYSLPTTKGFEARGELAVEVKTNIE